MKLPFRLEIFEVRALFAENSIDPVARFCSLIPSKICDIDVKIKQWNR